MSYLQSIGLGDDLVRSPSDARLAEMFPFIEMHRRTGKSDAEIVAILSKRSGLSRSSHPCADSKGNNICTSSEIARGMTSAASVVATISQRVTAAQKTKKTGAGANTLLLVGAAAVALWFLSKGKL